MTIYFANPGVIDLNVIRLMGVSVKENDTPIGYFGTGLKFALATLLRTGHEITIKAGKKEYDVTTKTQKIRGEEFDCVYLGKTKLGFTTKLGRNWEAWQAFRELHSNALDEGGTSSDKKQKADTVIKVTGDGIEEAFQNRHEIFLQTDPICSAAGVEVHPGGGQYVFYRGVRAGVLPSKSQFTYNVIKAMALSEDRNFKSLWDVEYSIETALPAMKDTSFISALLEGEDTWDHSLSFEYCAAPSKEFIEVAASRRSDHHLPDAAKAILARHAQDVESYPKCETKACEEYLIGDAIRLLRKIDCDLTRDELTVTETLGAGVYGLYHKSRDEIFIARQTLDNGLNFVAATLYEEWLHKRHRLEDKTRALQQFLFDRLISTAQALPVELEVAA